MITLEAARFMLFRHDARLGRMAAYDAGGALELDVRRFAGMRRDRNSRACRIGFNRKKGHWRYEHTA